MDLEAPYEINIGISLGSSDETKQTHNEMEMMMKRGHKNLSVSLTKKSGNN